MPKPIATVYADKTARKARVVIEATDAAHRDAAVEAAVEAAAGWATVTPHAVLIRKPADAWVGGGAEVELVANRMRAARDAAKAALRAAGYTVRAM